MKHDPTRPGGPAEGVSRRDFMRRAGVAAGGLALGAGIVPAEDAPAGVVPGSIAPPDAASERGIRFSSESPLRVALIGAGGRMTRGLLPHLLARPDVAIVAVADPDPLALARMIERVAATGRPRPDALTGYRDHAVALGRDDVQAAFAATPCDLHARIELEALGLGRHLYAERPACLSIAEARELERELDRLEAEGAAPVAPILQIGHQRRASARYAEGIAALHAGEIGEPLEIRAVRIGPAPTPRWLDSRDRSGDRMLEQAGHAWDVAYWATGELPRRAFGAGRRDATPATGAPFRDTTEFFVATLLHESGLATTFTYAPAAPRRDNGAFSGTHERILGTLGGIDLTAGRISYADPAREPRPLAPGEPEPTGAAVARFLERVRTGAPAVGDDLRTALAATCTGLLVRRAVDESRVVEMEEILAG